MTNYDKYSFSNKKVWIAGHNGMVGRAMQKRLIKENCEILTVNKDKLNLTNQRDTEKWISNIKPDVIIIAAARVGGIKANMLNKYSFLYENLMIQNNIINSARYASLDKLVFLGSSCIYPKNVDQPIKEEFLLSGKLEDTNEGYALAKIVGLKLCQYYNEKYNKDFISIMPSNLYGPFDNFDPESSHVLGSLMRKIYQAKEKNETKIEIWGTGQPRREFLYVDDLADAICYLIKNYNNALPINVGTSKDISIEELVLMISKILDYSVEISHNLTMPDGTMLKRLDTSKITELGWLPKTSLKEGIKKTFSYCEKYKVFKDYK